MQNISKYQNIEYHMISYIYIVKKEISKSLNRSCGFGFATVAQPDGAPLWHSDGDEAFPVPRIGLNSGKLGNGNGISAKPERI